MTFDIAFVLGLVLVVLALFVREVLPAETIALGALVVLVISGMLTPAEAFRSFGNEALVTVAAMFVLSAGLIRTGAVAFIGRRILAFGGVSEPRILLALMVVTALCSAFINNTPIAVIFLPIVLGLSEHSGVSASKLLIPMSYATICGGMCTLIGTSTNVLVSSMLPDFALGPMSMFTPLPLAAIGMAMTLAYMVLVGRRLLPERNPVTSAVSAGAIHDYVTELEVIAGSRLIGRPVREVMQGRASNVRLLQLVRGEEILAPDPRRHLEQGDILIVKGDVNSLLTLRRADGVELTAELGSRAVDARSRELTLVELLVRPAAAAIGETVADLALRARYGVSVIAVQRHGLHLREKVASLRLRFGDVLLVQADLKALAALHASPDFVVLEGVDARVVFTHKSWIALTIVASVVGLAAAQIATLPISVLAVAGALAMMACGCIGVREAYRAIDVPVLLLIGGSIALGAALQTTGAAEWLARGIVAGVRGLGPVALLSAVYLLANVLTAVISNTSAAVLMLPIAVSTARHAGLDPMPFVIATMFAASIDFSTPFGYQTNTFVYGPGGYRFADYVRVGGPLNLLWWLLATLIIPVLWPLHAAS